MTNEAITSNLAALSDLLIEVCTATLPNASVPSVVSKLVYNQTISMWVIGVTTSARTSPLRNIPITQQQWSASSVEEAFISAYTDIRDETADRGIGFEACSDKAQDLIDNVVP